ncbi:MAG: ADP-ribosylation/Crystallin [Cyanobacteria bacterium RYN_339]|nr:ADP-ribosylation/Crystallin [Cyanobacteria bacterium RYN_339]
MDTRLGGLLLGTAVGDAVGLPFEGLSPARARRLFPGPLRHRLIFGHGMVSDDTEHALFTAQAFLAHPTDVAAFQRALAWKLRGWLLGLPAGIGLATLRAIARMWLGVRRPGVRSAGNGPAMRAPVLGALLAGDADRLAAYVRAATELTHTDPQALTGALALARMAAWAVTAAGPPVELAPLWGEGDAEWARLGTLVEAHLARQATLAEFAAVLGLERGVTGYMYHSVPVAAYAWLRHWGDFEATVAGVVALGGDTDSVGSFAGALAGGVVGVAGIPPAWRAGIWDWPRGERVWLAVATATAPVGYFWPGVLVRNALFLAVVLAHGVRRLLPPYAGKIDA